MKENLELFLAKLSATLNLLWGNIDSVTTLNAARGYIDYKKTVNRKLELYLNHELELNLPDSWIKALRSHNIFYSYCFGLFKLMPAIMLYQGYHVAVLMSESFKFRESAYFQQLVDQCKRLNGIEPDILFLSHRENNLLFRMNSLLKMGYKIIFFIDGNKGFVEGSDKNLYVTPFKNTHLRFHQGFAWINYLQKKDVLHGLLLREHDGIVDCIHLMDKVEFDLEKPAYVCSVMNIVLRHLESLIQLDNVHKWNALLSVYKWSRFLNDNSGITHPMTKHFYTSFSLGENEYYILDHLTFNVYPVSEKIYQDLKV